MFNKSYWINFIFILSICSPIYSQNYIPPLGSPLANHEHPRLHFTASSFQNKIAPYINNYESSDFQNWIGAVESVYSTDPSTKDRKYLLADAIDFAFLSYAVSSGDLTGFNYGYTAQEYADKAYAHVQEIYTQGDPGESNHPSILGGGDGGYKNLTVALVYDWCYDYFGLAEKQYIADVLIWLWDGRDSDVNPGAAQKFNQSKIAAGHACGAGALAFYGDDLGAARADSATVILNSLDWYWYDRFYRYGEQIMKNSFGWNEGPNYMIQSMTNIIWFASVFGSAIDSNLFMNWDFLHDIGLYTYFYLEPMSVNGDQGYSGFFMQRNSTGSLLDWDDEMIAQSFTPMAALLKDDDPNHAGFLKWVMESSDYALTFSFDNDIVRIYWL